MSLYSAESGKFDPSFSGLSALPDFNANVAA
jgi:hypothetical protein